MLGAATVSARMPQASDITVTGLDARHDGSRLALDFNLDVSKMPTGQNIETRITPVVKSGNDSVRLESITLAGRNRLIQAQRTGAINDAGNTYYRSGKQKSFPYSSTTAWEPWMETADIDLVVENLGCCRSRMSLAERPMAKLNMGPREFGPAIGLQYITPVEERVKMRAARGEAYVDFVVNTVNIRPDYRNNPVELRKIRATIDSIKNDKDTKITTLTITGYASPEGSYANNERLAKGRTEALAEYVRNLYTFPRNLMKTSWVAEDWAGLRARVEKSDIANKAGILALIDSNLAPDVKDNKIRTDFPVQYKYMLENWYPALRHSDYTVAYEVRKYTDPAEIAQVFKKNPSKLSLRELFIYAETLEPTSPEYADVFETAARMYPNDEIANLNAANCALSSDRLQDAARYLSKVGDTPQATYARAILAVKEGKLAEATTLLAKAKAAGIDTKVAEERIAAMQAPKVRIF